jgi:hypothetical protein
VVEAGNAADVLRGFDGDEYCSPERAPPRSCAFRRRTATTRANGISRDFVSAETFKFANFY